MRSIAWDDESQQLRIIDQLALPGELRYLEIKSSTGLADALTSAAVNGALASAVCGAYGLYFASREVETRDPAVLQEAVRKYREHIMAAKPTGCCLRDLTARIVRQADAFEGEVDALRVFYFRAAQDAAEQNMEAQRALSRYGAELIHDKDAILHHGNTGGLTGAGNGTALGVIRAAHEQGKRVHVYLTETRPLLEGSRLTAWELEQYGISYEIVVDSAAGYLMRTGQIDKLFFGADCAAANGDVVNTIGTYMLAVAAYDNGIPAYAALPLSSVDFECPSAENIIIGERNQADVFALQYRGLPAAPEGATARNFALDVTPHRLLSGLITDRGVLYPPFFRSLSVLRQFGREE